MSKDTKKKTDKQIFRRWIVVMVLAFVGGGIGGFFSVPISAFLKDTIAKIEVNEGVMSFIALAGFVIFNIVCIGITYCFYKKSKNMSEQWDGEDEEQIEVIEKKLDYAMLALTFASCCNQFIFAFTSYVSMGMSEQSAFNYFIVTILDVVIFIGASFVFVALQKKIVELIKKLNPEKQGNIFDKNFQKEWLASCDEAQQLVIYKASFKAYKAVVNTCKILWIVTLIGMLTFDTGLFPVFCVTVIMVVMQVSYALESMKLERGNK